MTTTKQELIDIIEQIKSIASDADKAGDLGKANVERIVQICEDTIIKWKCEKRLNDEPK